MIICATFFVGVVAQKKGKRHTGKQHDYVLCINGVDHLLYLRRGEFLP